jgi:ribulose kinase
MKTTYQTSSVPTEGVLVICEGLLTRLFFDFAPTQTTDEDGKSVTLDPPLYKCENVDVWSRSYSAMVAAIVNDRYGMDAVQAIMANFQTAKDENSELSDEKRSEYLSEYAAYQSWRAHAKNIARQAVSIISE